jgi:hypothetical protein
MERWNDGRMEGTISPRYYFIELMWALNLTPFLPFGSAYRYRYQESCPAWILVVLQLHFDTHTVCLVSTSRSGDSLCLG